MSDLKRFGSEVWDRLFDLLYDCDESVTDAEVQADLRRAGIDMRPAYRRMHQIIEEKTAREQFANAAETRTSLMERLRGVIAPPVEDLRTGLRELIARAFSGEAQVAHFQKLEKAASDEDLKSLMDDLTKLAALRQRQDKDDLQAE